MKIGDSQQSKIKMMIMTKAGHKNLVWWSPVKQNRKRSELIINGMVKRFMTQTEIVKITNVLMFYENEMLIAKAKI